MTKVVSKKTRGEEHPEEKQPVSLGLPKPKKHYLTGTEMAFHQAFGIWKDREDMGDGTKFIKKMRAQEGKRAWK